MAADNPEERRNLSMEVDEMKRRMDEIAESQRKMEKILSTMRETLTLIGAVRNTRVTGPHSHLLTIASMRTNPGITAEMPVVRRTSNTAQLVIPIGEGYRSSEDTRNKVHGNAESTWEQPGVSIPVTTGLPARSGHAVIQRDKMEEEWKERMEEQINAIKGPSAYGQLRIEELCPTIDVVIPKDFKIPHFAKYDGSSNPWFHLISYGTKMTVWSRDDKFLVSFFHESLTGPALEWYLQLDRFKISRWTELADLFMEQYKFNLDAAPTREQLSSMQKENEEAFKQYAQRWRAVAAQVQPPLTLAEMCSYFLGTLGAPYIEIMAGAVYPDFAELIAAGERIEILVKAGKLSTGNDENGFKTGFIP